MNKQSVLKLSKLLCVLLIVGHFLTESSTMAYLRWPVIDKIKIRPWLDSEYVFYGDEEGMILKWFIKALTNDLLDVITYFVFMVIAKKVSFRLYLVVATFFGYHIADLFLLFYDYKTSVWIYIMLNVTICISIVYLFIPEKRRGKIKYME